jgi:hypothetical protein
MGNNLSDDMEKLNNDFEEQNKKNSIEFGSKMDKNDASKIW